MKLSIDSDIVFQELDFLKEDKELLSAAKACLDAHKTWEEKLLKTTFRPNPRAAEEVSEEALQAILRKGKKVNGILTDRYITNCVIFDLPGVKDMVKEEEISELRQKLDRIVTLRVRGLFGMPEGLWVYKSGHFLYPPGGFMSWHTNANGYGWRLYINYVEEPGKSFFRYRDPDTGKIMTLWDKEWNFRVFKIDPKRLFWHAVYSETNRYSFGFRIHPEPKLTLPQRVARKAKTLLEKAGVTS